jgi:DNA-directed RNA polymerase specialized sigma24 family protein
LRLRSDQQLVALFRAGHDEAFRVLHDRYRPRLAAYVSQMLSGRSADVEDALQDVFVRTYAGLRAGDRELALRPWLFRMAHNRCIDELRRTAPPPPELLRRLVVDIGRLPEQQRSALLMRELSGMAYADVADTLGMSVPAVKSLLVRARIGLSQWVEARDAACADVRRQLAEAHERGVRPSWTARRHLRDCRGCQACRSQLRSSRRQLAALIPALGPLGLLARLFGTGGGAGGGSIAAAGTGGGLAASAGGVASGLASITVGHMATLVAAAVVAAGGAVELQRQVVAPATSRPAVHSVPQPAGAGRARTPAPVYATPQVPSRTPAPTRARPAHTRAAIAVNQQTSAPAPPAVPTQPASLTASQPADSLATQTAAPETTQPATTTTGSTTCATGTSTDPSCSSTPAATTGTDPQPVTATSTPIAPKHGRLHKRGGSELTTISGTTTTSVTDEQSWPD